MRYLFGIVMLVLISITSSLIVQQLGIFPQTSMQSAGSPALFAKEPAFHLRCGSFTSGVEFDDVLAIVGGAGRNAGCDGVRI